MRKKDELSLEHTCMQHAHPEEMVFVLLGRDPAAPVAIRAWVHERLRLGKNAWSDTQIQEALACADVMTAEGRKWVDAPIKRLPGCKCHWEEGDSPCPVHGDEGATTSTGHAKAIQEIDAALFNGDAFDVPAARAELVSYVERWARELACHLDIASAVPEKQWNPAEHDIATCPSEEDYVDGWNDARAAAIEAIGAAPMIDTKAILAKAAGRDCAVLIEGVVGIADGWYRLRGTP